MGSIHEKTTGIKSRATVLLGKRRCTVHKNAGRHAYIFVGAVDSVLILEAAESSF
jgi:hypothetical protein